MVHRPVARTLGMPSGRGYAVGRARARSSENRDGKCKYADAGDRTRCREPCAPMHCSSLRYVTGSEKGFYNFLQSLPSIGPAIKGLMKRLLFLRQPENEEAAVGANDVGFSPQIILDRQIGSCTIFGRVTTADVAARTGFRISTHQSRADRGY